MAKKIELRYPHGLIVFAMVDDKYLDLPDIQQHAQIGNSFMIWLKDNYIEDDSINLGLALLYNEPESWHRSAILYGIERPYIFFYKLLKLFREKTIEVEY